MVNRVFVEKRAAHASAAAHLCKDLCENLEISSLEKVRILNRYDTENLSEAVLQKAKTSVFSEPQTDLVFSEAPQDADFSLCVEYLPGQYDQRADFAAQCIELCGAPRPIVRTARLYLFYGSLSQDERSKIETYLVNPVECRVASDELPETLATTSEAPEKVATIEGFITLADSERAHFLQEHSLAMDEEDLSFLRDYFRDNLKRNPTQTELKLLDTYWSDHCRHTTFATEIDRADIQADYIYSSFERYLAQRRKLYGKKQRPVTLMDLATIGTKLLKKRGLLPFLDESEEINACSVCVNATTPEGDEPWLLMFKNETHNHPTEIEPFGGAATCLGGAIRDPLSGRAYVYQSMRVTGAGDVTKPISETLPGKLPQRKLTVTAAQGFSSYGNQIGLATGGVYEYYHPGYTAKRMELGAVVGAVKKSNVVRRVPKSGDRVLLVGGATGRDGCGGATGSSKAHTLSSLSECGAEVQKGNPPEERKLQRLFRNPLASRMIKRCNDFGAGGVAVAVGELADGLYIDLDRVPKKYEGLTGTELAISESQERMAVVVAEENVTRFQELAAAENLSAEVVAAVTDEKKMVMDFGDQTIVSLPRELLNSAGAKKHTAVHVPAPDTAHLFDGLSALFETKPLGEALRTFVGDLRICSQKGLVERFDASIGASSVLLPFGGLTRETPTQSMVALLPVPQGTTTCSAMAHGFSPYLCEKSPYHGGLYAVVEAVTKLVATGVRADQISLSLQEFFPRTKGDAERFGLPFSALLGALDAQLSLGIAAIGGKDSMSGSFENIDVPPTLVAFGVSVIDAQSVVTPELKGAGHFLTLLSPLYDENGVVDFKDLSKMQSYAHTLMRQGKVLSAYSVGEGGALEALLKMAFGNRVGVDLSAAEKEVLTRALYGSLVLETKDPIRGTPLGMTVEEPALLWCGERFMLNELSATWEKTLSGTFPLTTRSEAPEAPERICYDQRTRTRPLFRSPRPRVLIPVFPGTNCEYDSARAFTTAGADSQILVFTNRTKSALASSIHALADAIRASQILMLPGGFSAGDEPDGSAKFITAVLKCEEVREAISRLLQRDGLILGICNGFQALIKSGLLPFGEIGDRSENDATLTYNEIGRHQSLCVRTRVASVHSPWFSSFEVGDTHTVPVSHGEGRFFAPQELLDKLNAAGQIATQYTDMDGAPTMDIPYNPNGSALAIEGIFSPDGRIFGKMGHSERCGALLAQNLPDASDTQLQIFRNGVRYYR